MIDGLQEHMERIRVLLTMRLTTGLTPEETQELELYCQKEPALRLLIQRLDDRELTQKMIQRRRQAENKVAEQPSKHRLRWIGYAAAALILSAVAISLFRTTPSVKVDKAVSIASSTAPHHNSHVTLTLPDGQELILKDANNTYQASAHPGATDSLNINTLATSQSSQYGVVLPDGSKVWLDTASSLRFPAAFSGSQRKVELTGQAYFEIAPNSRQSFSVIVRNKIVDVLGTIFNISAYPHEKNIRTTVVDGKIKVSYKENSITLIQNQQLTSGPDDIGQLEKDVDIRKAVAWNQSVLTFDDSLRQVLSTLARRYNKELQLNTRLEKLYFRGAIDSRKTLEEALSYISHSQSIFKYQITDTKVIISRYIIKPSHSN